MKSVLLRAPVLTQSGYGVHARQVARWLLSKETECQLDIAVEALPWGLTPWILDTNAQDGLIGKLMERTGNRKSLYDLTIQLQLPNEWDSRLGRFNVGITAGVEVDRCNPAWIEAINRMNLVVVPAQFVKDTFLNTGKVTTSIVVVPEAFPDELLEETDAKLDLNVPANFNFLVFGQFTGNNPENDRKNLFYTIKWLCEEFANDKDVGIILKTNVSRNSKIDRQATRNLVSKLIMEVRKTEFPKIHLIHGEMTNEEVKALYSNPKVKALVSLTRGEGFGLPLLEAAACGLPVVATDWSAHTEFLNHGKFIKVDRVLKEIHETRVDNTIFMPGAKWAEPSEADAKRRLRRLKDSYETPKEWARELQKEIRNRYNFKTISGLYDQALGELLK
jgi:glycosyltransferase involved in cell wall biosynthesis